MLCPLSEPCRRVGSNEGRKLSINYPRYPFLSGAMNIRLITVYLCSKVNESSKYFRNHYDKPMQSMGYHSDLNR